MSKTRWRPAYIGLGSNLQGPAGQIESALDELREIPETRMISRSSLYRSSPLGGIEQPDFVNAVAAVLTTLEPRDLLRKLKAIERRRGRERNGQRWGPRVIDLDLLVFSRAVLSEAGLSIPHPGIAERNFVLLPLREIAPDLVIPGLGRVASIAINEAEPAIDRIA